MRPLVTSWSHGLPFPERFDLQGTVDHSSWVAVPDGLAAWAAPRRLGAGPRATPTCSCAGPSTCGTRSARTARTAAYPPPRACASSRCPDGVATTTEDAEALWQRLHAAGFVVPPVAFDGRGYLRLAAAPYNDEDDYARLAAVLPGVLAA